jgi:hypothetical protein
MDKVEVIKLIKTTLTRIGEGIEDDPVRILTQYWDLDGNLILEFDPYLDKVIFTNCDKI